MKLKDLNNGDVFCFSGRFVPYQVVNEFQSWSPFCSYMQMKTKQIFQSQDLYKNVELLDNIKIINKY